MLVPFDTLPESSKVWIYQASRPMTAVENEMILKSAENFVEQWTAHQAGLKAGVKLFYNAFIVFAVDESYNDASGCSIDKKVHFVKNMEQQTGIQFFDRMKVAYMTGESGVCIVSLAALNENIIAGKLNMETMVFNNLVSTMKEFKNMWKIPLRESWVFNFIEKNLV